MALSAYALPRALALGLLLVAACSSSQAAPLGLVSVTKPPSGGAGAPLSNDEWSSIVGWISVACWIWPSWSQLLENHINKSGEGLSILFVYLWLAGDALNMIGAMRLHLLPTMIVLAGYYCLCDVVLIWQYYYYRRYWDYYHPSAVASESTSLLPPSSSGGAASSSAISAHGGASASHISVPPKSPEPRSDWRLEALKYMAAFGLVVGAGVAAWAVSEYQGSKHTGNKPPPSAPSGEWKWDAQISGWASAALYLSSRIPQLFKNVETHCEGLSFSLFLFAVGGNLTYVLSIVLKSTDRDYLIENASWIVGSLGTVLLDFGVLAQFFLYRGAREADRLAAAEARANGGVAPPSAAQTAVPTSGATATATAGMPSAP